MSDKIDAEVLGTVDLAPDADESALTPEMGVVRRNDDTIELRYNHPAEFLLSTQVVPLGKSATEALDRLAAVRNALPEVEGGALTISDAGRYENVFVGEQMVASYDHESGEFLVYDADSTDPEYRVEVDDA